MKKKHSEPNEVSEMWRDFKAEGQQKRAANREYGPALLAGRGITFESKNNGAHIIVTACNCIWDYWPGTGKFKRRDLTRYRRGIRNLVAEIETISKEHGSINSGTGTDGRNG